MHRVLIGNDDGIWAPGIRALCVAMADAGFEVYVCAPDRERSAVSHGLTMGVPIRCEELGLPGAVQAWSTTGTPADSMKMALEVLLSERPDLVVTGVNRGPNLGTDVRSGTVAAAMEGPPLGYRPWRCPRPTMNLPATPTRPRQPWPSPKRCCETGFPRRAPERERARRRRSRASP